MRRFRAVAFPLVLVLAAGGCGSEEPVETAGPELLQLGAEQVMVQMEHIMTRGGLRRAHLLADTAYFLQDDPLVRMLPVDLTFYDVDGRAVSHLTAREGWYDTETNDMEARGDVVVLDHREGQRLLTEELEYVAADDRLRSDREFALYRTDAVVRGTGFVADPALDTVHIVQPAGEAHAVEDGDPPPEPR